MIEIIFTAVTQTKTNSSYYFWIPFGLGLLKNSQTNRINLKRVQILIFFRVSCISIQLVLLNVWRRYHLLDGFRIIKKKQILFTSQFKITTKFSLLTSFLQEIQDLILGTFFLLQFPLRYQLQLKMHCVNNWFKQGSFIFEME